MGIMVYPLLWVMQDLDHQPYVGIWQPRGMWLVTRIGSPSFDESSPEQTPLGWNIRARSSGSFVAPAVKFSTIASGFIIEHS